VGLQAFQKKLQVPPWPSNSAKKKTKKNKQTIHSNTDNRDLDHPDFALSSPDLFVKIMSDVYKHLRAKMCE